MKDHLAKLGKGTLIYGLGQGVAKLIGFILLPLLTAYLTPADYGIISLLQLISLLAAPIFGLGLGSSIGIVYFSEPGTLVREQTTWTSFIVLSVMSVLLITTVVVFANPISILIFQSPEYADLVKIMIISTVFNSIVSTPLFFRLQYEEKSKVYVLITALGTLLTVGLTVLMVVVYEKGVWGFMIAALIGNFVSFLAYFIAIVGWTKFSFSRSVLISLIRSGIPLILSFFFLFLLQTNGRFFLQRYRGISDIGIYSIGHTFGMIINLAVNSFYTSWFPYFNSFNRRLDEAKQIFGKIAIYYTLIFGTATILLIIFAKPLVIILTTHPFHEAYLVIGIICTANFLVGVDAVLVPGVYFNRQVYLMNYIQLGAALVSIGSGLLLIPEFGMLGAAIALLLGYAGLVIFQIILNKLSHTIPVVYQKRRFVYFFLTLVLFGFVNFIPREFSIFEDIAFCSLQTLVLFILIFLQLNVSEKELVRQIWRDKSLKGVRI